MSDSVGRVGWRRLHRTATTITSSGACMPHYSSTAMHGLLEAPPSGHDGAQRVSKAAPSLFHLASFHPPDPLARPVLQFRQSQIGSPAPSAQGRAFRRRERRARVGCGTGILLLSASRSPPPAYALFQKRLSIFDPSEKRCFGEFGQFLGCGVGLAERRWMLARDHGLRTGQPRQGRNAATATRSSLLWPSGFFICSRVPCAARRGALGMGA